VHTGFTKLERTLATINIAILFTLSFILLAVGYSMTVLAFLLLYKHLNSVYLVSLACHLVAIVKYDMSTLNHVV